jgi:CheY-like chemotaxis protein
MPSVRVIHSRSAEAGPLLDACRKTGLEVDYLEGDGAAVTRAIRAKLPDVVAIDLSRLPSHGREVAIWLRGAKSTRGIPIVFVGGEPAKVAAIRELLPDAAYCEVPEAGTVATRLAGATRQRSAVAPTPMMERGREKPAAQKLGIGSGSAVCVVEPPREFPALLGDLPDAVEFREDPAPVTLWFLQDRENFLASLRQMRVIAGRTKLWLLWRKGSGAEITQNSVRDAAREVGLVDYKICSVDPHWSAMLFARKKA